MDVIAPAAGAMMLVESYRPPRPTSMTATSTRARRNSSKAMAVVGLEEGGLNRRTTSRLERISTVEDIPRGVPQRVRIDRRGSNDEPLLKIDKVGRAVSAGMHTSGDQRGVHHRGDRALAVRAGDVECRERLLGMPQRGTQPGDVVEPKSNPERIEREETVEQLRPRVGIGLSAWASRRAPGEARGARMPGVCKRRATQPGGMHRWSRW